MRKLILVGVIGFLLVGCGGDKITKEFLAGSWSCDSISYEDMKSAGEYEKVNSSNFIAKMEIIDGSLYRIEKNYDNIKVDESKIDGTHKFTREDDNFKSTSITTSKKLSNDSYSIVRETEIDNLDGGFKSKFKTETICNRIN